MVRQQQDMFWGGRRSAVSLGASPDWELLARAFGVAARSHRRRRTRSPTRWTRRWPSPVPRCCTCAIAPEANCLPMFRPGGPAREMIG